MPKVNYINNKTLHKVLVQYNEEKKINKEVRVPEYVGESILLIANRLASKSNFVGYSYKDEMISDGIENCLAAVPLFDVRLSNPFAYFTTIMWRSFVQRINKEKRQHYLKLKHYKKRIAQLELDNSIPTLYNPSMDADDEVIDSFIADYERKVEEKKQKIKKKKGIENFYDENK